MNKKWLLKKYWNGSKFFSVHVYYSRTSLSRTWWDREKSSRYPGVRDIRSWLPISFYFELPPHYRFGPNVLISSTSLILSTFLSHVESVLRGSPYFSAMTALDSSPFFTSFTAWNLVSVVWTFNFHLTPPDNPTIPWKHIFLIVKLLDQVFTWKFVLFLFK